MANPMTFETATHQVYLDHNATTPVSPGVIDVMVEALALGGNGSSVHGHGRRARAAIETARRQVADMIGAAPEGVVFTSGGTEANNLALSGSGRRRVLVGATEHDSVFGACGHAQVIPVDGDGIVELRALRDMLAADDTPAVVSVMLANNETGVIQPLDEVVSLAHAHGALVHTDAIQAAGRIPLDMRRLGVDLLSVSAHKFGGPQGVGALVLKPGSEAFHLQPMLRGGGQEKGRRAGTENLPGIVGMGCAAAQAAKRIAAGPRIEKIRRDLERQALAVVGKSTIFGSKVTRLPNTSCLTMPGVTSEVQVMALDLAGVMVGAGAACSSGKVSESRVLRAMGVRAEDARSAIRISLSPDSTEMEVSRFVSAWSDLWRRKNKRQSTTQSTETNAA